jgi:hypothetical protein
MDVDERQSEEESGITKKKFSQNSSERSFTNLEYVYKQ